jgi:hypothetical protein
LAPMLRKTLGPVMIVLVICQIGAAWTLFSTAIWIHKQNKQSRLADKGRWEQFIMTTYEFESTLIEECEIEIKGQLYDIVSSEISDGMVTITAVADHAENKMKRTLRGLQKEETGWSEVAKKAQLFSMAVFHPEKNLQFFGHTFLITTEYFHYPDNNFSEGFLGRQVQPPTL